MTTFQLVCVGAFFLNHAKIGVFFLQFSVCSIKAFFYLHKYYIDDSVRYTCHFAKSDQSIIIISFTFFTGLNYNMSILNNWLSCKVKMKLLSVCLKFNTVKWLWKKKIAWKMCCKNQGMIKTNSNVNYWKSIIHLCT